MKPRHNNEPDLEPEDHIAARIYFMLALILLIGIALGWGLAG